MILEVSKCAFQGPGAFRFPHQVSQTDTRHSNVSFVTEQEKGDMKFVLILNEYVREPDSFDRFPWSVWRNILAYLDKRMERIAADISAILSESTQIQEVWKGDPTCTKSFGICSQIEFEIDSISKISSHTFLSMCSFIYQGSSI